MNNMNPNTTIQPGYVVWYTVRFLPGYVGGILHGLHGLYRMAYRTACWGSFGHPNVKKNRS